MLLYKYSCMIFCTFIGIIYCLIERSKYLGMSRSTTVVIFYCQLIHKYMITKRMSLSPSFMTPRFLYLSDLISFIFWMQNLNIFTWWCVFFFMMMNCYAQVFSFICVNHCFVISAIKTLKLVSVGKYLL